MDAIKRWAKSLWDKFVLVWPTLYRTFLAGAIAGGLLDYFRDYDLSVLKVAGYSGLLAVAKVLVNIVDPNYTTYGVRKKSVTAG